MGLLFLNIYRQDQYPLSQTDMRFKIVPRKPELALIAYGVTKVFKVMFEENVLYVPRFTLISSVIRGHTAGLNRQNATYALLHSEVKTYTFTKGQMTCTRDRLIPDRARKMLMIAMVENYAFNGSIGKNPFYFQHFDLT